MEDITVALKVHLGFFHQISMVSISTYICLSRIATPIRLPLVLLFAQRSTFVKLGNAEDLAGYSFPIVSSRIQLLSRSQIPVSGGLSS